MNSRLDKQFKGDLVASFDDRWELLRCGSEGVSQFLKKWNIEPNNERELLAELIQVDIERAWQDWGARRAKRLVNDNAQTILLDFQQLPRIENYWNLYGSELPSKAEIATLAAHECNVRDSFGDAIGPQHYLGQFGVELTGKRRFTHRMALVTRYEDVDSPSADHSSVQVDPFGLQGVEVRGLTMLGRQRSTDPDDRAFESLPEGNRLIVADRNDVRVSRKHAAVHRITSAFAVVSNVSRLNRILVDDGRLIEPQSQVCLEFPFTLQLPGVIGKFQ